MNRTLDFSLELKALEESGSFSGYASTFGDLDSYGDRVEPGAFRDTLADWQRKGRWPSLLWSHDTSEPVGTFTSMAEDTRGLHVEGKLALRTRRGAEAHELLKLGAVSGLSIGYTVKRDEIDRQTGVRTLKAVDLWEVSLVSIPANDGARIGAVKAALRAGHIPTKRELERFLREAGFSKSQSAALLADGYAGIERRDADSEALTLAVTGLLDAMNYGKEI